MWEVDGTGSLSFATWAYVQLAELKFRLPCQKVIDFINILRRKRQILCSRNILNVTTRKEVN